MRMIDGELGLPDEAPPRHLARAARWHAHGMVTLRRETGRHHARDVGQRRCEDAAGLERLLAVGMLATA